MVEVAGSADIVPSYNIIEAGGGVEGVPEVELSATDVRTNHGLYEHYL